MIPKRLLFPIIALLLLVLVSMTSCRRDESVRTALARAESLMESDPHAARAVLDSLENVLRRPSTLSRQPSSPRLSKSDAALYALLRTQADYKCDVPLTSDSLARIATDYYGVPRHPDYHAAMAWYTLGCVYKETSDDINGTDAFLKAKSLFPDTLIRYYALAEQNLGLHYLKRFMYSESTRELKRAKQNLIRLGDSTTVAFLDLKLAQCYLYKNDDITSKKYIEQTLKNSHARAYVINDAHFELAKIEAYDNHDYRKAHEALNYKICHTNNKRMLAGTYNLKAVVFQEQGLLDSAWHYYNRSLSCQPDLASFAYDYLQMASLAPQMGKSDSIQAYIQLHDHYIDSLYAISNQQAIRQVMNDHRVEMEQQRLENEHRHLLFMGIAIFVIVCFALLAFYLYQRNRNNRKTIALQEAIRKSNVVLMNLTVPTEEDSTAISAETLSNPDAYIRLFCLGRQLLNPKIMEELKKLSVISGGEEANHIRNKYTEALDHAFVDLMMILKLVSPSLNKQDLQYIISRMLGLDDKLIQVIQDTYDSTFRMRRNRLNKKIPDGLRPKLLSPVDCIDN